MDFKSIIYPGGGGPVRWAGGAAAARDERGAAGHREVLRAPHGAEARARGARAQRGARVQQRAVRGLGAGHRAQEHSQDTPAWENTAGADNIYKKYTETKTKISTTLLCFLKVPP